MKLSFNSTVILLVAFASMRSFSQNVASTLNARCEQEGHACGECESKLQQDINSIIDDLYASPPKKNSGHWSEFSREEKLAMKPGVKLEDTLEKITNAMRANNPKGDGKLNYVIIGESESKQPTRPGYPRIALKSPEGEFSITFNTDPESEAYNTLEIRRWDGKNGKYIFQEIDFGDKDSGRPAHVDNSGKACMECHKAPNPRPNWGTYRSWDGIVPPRDDMLETDSFRIGVDKSKQKGPDANARA